MQTAAGAIRVVLVEPQGLIREAIRVLLQTVGNIAIVGEANRADEIVRVVDGQRPDAVLFGLDGPGERELEGLQELANIAGHVRVLVLTSHNDAALCTRAIELGAMGVIGKDQPGQVLVKALQKVCAGEIWLDRAHTAGVVNRLTRRRIDQDPESVKIESLTPRERQIVTLVTEGLKNKEIAERLFISESTARNHLTSILDKLDLANRFELAVYAFRRGLVICPQTPAMLRSSETMLSRIGRQQA